MEREHCAAWPQELKEAEQRRYGTIEQEQRGAIYIIQFGEFGDPPIPYLSKFSYFVSLYISLFYSFHCSITYRESGGKPVL